LGCPVARSLTMRPLFGASRPQPVSVRFIHSSPFRLSRSQDSLASS
jgi:hypothetical protein